MDTKYCPKCQTSKSVEEFGKNKAKNDGLQSVCKTCKAAYGAAHYQENKEAYAASARTAQRKLRDEIHALKEADPCVDCGGRFPYYVMQYDHLGDKIDHVARLVSQGVGRARIMAEIAKCELVCANCHCVRTHNRLVDSGAEEE